MVFWRGYVFARGGLNRVFIVLCQNVGFFDMQRQKRAGFEHVREFFVLIGIVFRGRLNPLLINSA
jgi:hypothetical protein